MLVDPCSIYDIYNIIWFGHKNYTFMLIHENELVRFKFRHKTGLIRFRESLCFGLK